MWNPFRKKPTFDVSNLSEEDKKQILIQLGLEDLFIGSKSPLGDGKAVFMDDGYAEEADELKKEESGLKAWYKRIGL